MKIHSLHIDGFGHFADRDFGPFASGVTVLEGLNEAGKSTLLAFIRMVLFGWPGRKRGEWYPALRGGRHGGRISLIDDEGRNYNVERWEEPRATHFALTTPDGERRTNEADLQRLLGHPTKAMFDEVFAFDIDVLQDLKEASSNIFEASTGMRGLPAALKAIDTRRDAVFRPGGSSQRVASILRSLDEVQQEIAQASGQAAEYGDLTGRIRTVGQQIEDAETELAAAMLAERESADLRSGWEPWVRSEETHAELRRLPDTGAFPEDGLTRLHSAEQALAAANTRHEAAATALHDAHERQAAIHLDSQLLAEASAITTLTEGVGGYRSSVADLPKRQSATRNTRAELDEALTALGPGWDRPRVEALELSLPVQQQVRAHEDTIADLSTAVVAARTEDKNAIQRLIEAQATEEAAHAALSRSPLPSVDRAALNARRDDLRACRSLDARQRDAREARIQLEMQANRQPQRAQPDRRLNPALRRALTAGLVLVALLGLIPLAAGAPVGIMATLVIEGLTVAAGVYIWGRGPIAPLLDHFDVPFVDELANARDIELQLASALEHSLARLGVETPGPEAYDRVEARLSDTERGLTANENAAVVHQQALLLLHKAEREREASRAALQIAEEAVEEAASSWQTWLAGLGLPEGLQPSGAVAFLQQVTGARALIAELHGPDGRVHRERAIAADVAAYDASVAALCSRLHLDPPASGSAAIAMVNTLVQRLNEATEARNNLRHAREAVASAQSASERSARDLEAAHKHVRRVLADGGAADNDEYRTRANAAVRRRALQMEHATCLKQLAVLSGPGEALDQFRAQLQGSTAASLDARLVAANGRLTDAQERRDALLVERTRCETRLAQLIDGTHASELLARRESLREDLRDIAGQWAKLTVARTVLERARRRWQDERQPAVVREASAFFANITGQRYSRIVPQLESGQLCVDDATSGAQKDVAQLSRGTREQLYLALRFGLIRQFETPLPVIVDEVLVNFDAARAERVAEAFARLAQTNQVLVFTCHEWVAAMFERTSSAQVISLGQVIEQGAAAFAPRLFAEIS